MIISEYNSTDRSKLGTKRDILADKDGISLYAIITLVNTYDITSAIYTVENLVIMKSEPSTT